MDITVLRRLMIFVAVFVVRFDLGSVFFVRFRFSSEDLCLVIVLFL